MHEAVFFSDHGGPNVLTYGKIKSREPNQDEVLISQTAIGVNDIDVVYRSGAIPLSGATKIIGFEGCGIVESFGSDVTNFRQGDRVIYATAPIGAYCRKRCLNSRYIIKLPNEMDDVVAAATFFKALTAHYLLFRAFLIREGVTILVHNVANPLNQILVRWASLNKDARVIGTIASDQHKQLALSVGCSHVLNYKSENWDKELIDYTSGVGVKAVYDSVGRETFNKSLRVLTKLGIIISYGQSSGKIGAIDFESVLKNSIFLTSPSLFDYKSNRMELILSASEVFALFNQKNVKVPSIQQYKMSEVQKAHTELEAGSDKCIVLV